MMIHLGVGWEAVVDVATWVAHAGDWTEWANYQIILIVVCVFTVDISK